MSKERRHTHLRRLEILLENNEYSKVATNLIDYSFKEYRDSERNDPASPSYGLLGWAYTHKGTYYGDDNARFLFRSHSFICIIK